jgi:hypothetical protein
VGTVDGGSSQGRSPEWHQRWAEGRAGMGVDERRERGWGGGGGGGGPGNLFLIICTHKKEKKRKTGERGVGIQE